MGKKIGSGASSYTVSGGKIKDSAGVPVSRGSVAADARRAASLAKGNADTSRNFAPARKFSELANKKLQGDAENARDAIYEANRQMKAPNPNGAK